MSLAAGTRLGPYEITALLGAGGMGEVYRGRDTRLGRDVAIKVLPPAFAQDPDRRARFEREAQTVAATSHPHIVSLFDTGEHAGQVFVVMELLEGETLRARLNDGGALPTRKAIECAVQIARGLAAAHDKGLVHRDLKPDNIFLLADGHVKILDFGLARAAASEPAGSGATETVAALTDPGLVMGTIGYMAPEQVRGRVVDGRADLFAFGSVLYEMLTGTRAFERETPADTMTAILKEDPQELATVRADLPPALDRIVRHCLEKNPAERFQSARDVAFALEALSGSAATAVVAAAPGATAVRRLPPRELIAWATAVLAIAGAVFLLFRSPSAAPAQKMAHFSAQLENTTAALNVDVAVAPDGDVLVMRVAGVEDTRLRLRRLDSVDVQVLAGTEGASQPFWSHDGTSIGFMVDRVLKRFDLQSSSIQPIATLDKPYGAPAWARDGTILLGSGAIGTLHRLRPNTATPEPMGTLDEANQELAQGRPVFLPDGRRFFYQSRRLSGWTSVLASLDTGTRLPLAGDDIRVVWAGEQDVIYRKGEALYAQAIDYATPALQGEPTLLAADLESGAGREAASSAVVAFMPRSSRGQQFAWYGRDGKRLGKVGEPGQYTTFDLSNDGRQIAAGVRTGTSVNLWMINAERGTKSRLTLDSANDTDPRWSPDGTKLIFGSTRDRSRSPHLTGPAAEAPSLLWKFDGRIFAADDWSRDGRWLLFHDATSPVLQAREIDAQGHLKGEPQVVARGLAGNVDQAQMSPDGHWIAYNINESGQSEVFVVPFPPTGTRYPLSRGGGLQPTWRGDSGELYYLTSDRVLRAVKVTVSKGVPEFSDPIELARPRLGAVSPAVEQYAPHPSGSRFLVLETAGEARDLSIDVILNWRSLVKQD